MIDRTQTIKMSVGCRARLRYRRIFSTGIVRPLQGEVYAWTIYGPDGDVISSVTSTIEQDLDGDVADMVHPLGVTAVCASATGLRWELAEVLGPAEGREVRFGGRFVVTRGPDSVAGTAPAFARGAVDMIIEKDRSL